MAIKLKEYDPKPACKISNLQPMYLYGMRLRGFFPGCQPMSALEAVMKGNKKYYNILIYSRELTDDEVRDYGLDRLEEAKTERKN